MDELDWVVANGGADIRHASADGGGWSADDSWEQHIDWRWVKWPVVLGFESFLVSRLYQAAPDQLTGRMQVHTAVAVWTCRFCGCLPGTLACTRLQPPEQSLSMMSSASVFSVDFGTGGSTPH